MEKGFSQISDQNQFDKLQQKLDELRKQQGHLEKYHERYRINKKIIKEWGNLLKKTKQGAQKILATQLKYMEACYDDVEQINNIDQILNQTKEMLNSFCGQVSSYENELLKQHLQLKEQGKKLSQIDKYVKDSYKTEKEFYDQINKKFKDQQQKISKNSLLNFKMIPSLDQGDQSASKDQSSLLQTNQSFIKTTAGAFIQALEIFHYEIEQQMIISTNKCYQCAQCVQKAMKNFDFQNLNSQIPDYVIQKNQQKSNQISEFIQNSKKSKVLTSQFLSQHCLDQSLWNQNLKDNLQKCEISTIQKNQKESQAKGSQYQTISKYVNPQFKASFNPYSQNESIQYSNAQEINVLQNTLKNLEKGKAKTKTSEQKFPIQSENIQTPQKQTLNISKDQRIRQSNQESSYSKEFQFPVNQSDVLKSKDCQGSAIQEQRVQKSQKENKQMQNRDELLSNQSKSSQQKQIQKS